MGGLHPAADDTLRAQPAPTHGGIGGRGHMLAIQEDGDMGQLGASEFDDGAGVVRAERLINQAAEVLIGHGRDDQALACLGPDHVLHGVDELIDRQTRR